MWEDEALGALLTFDEAMPMDYQEKDIGLLNSLTDKGLLDLLLDMLEKMEIEEEVVPLQPNHSHELLLGEHAHMMNIAA